MSEIAPTARLEAHFESVRERTQLTRCFAKSPLKIAKTFPLESGVRVCVMDCSPGMLAGDHYEFSWHLGANTAVEVTTQGFTRVHPSLAHPCTLHQKIALEPGAYLEHFPEPLMLFHDAAIKTECQVDLAPKATLLMGEIVCAGRIERGEVFAFRSWQSRTRVRRAGKLIYVAQNALRPDTLTPSCVGSWGDYTHAGTFCVFSPHVGAEFLPALRALLENRESSNVWAGASQLDCGALVVSLLGRRAHDLQELTHQMRLCVRQHLACTLS